MWTYKYFAKICPQILISSKLNWGSYTDSIAKTACKKIGALIRSMNFPSPEVVHHIYKSTLWHCTEYCCHGWAGALSCYLKMFAKLQKQICRAIGPFLATSLEPLAHCWDLTTLSHFYRYYFGRCSTELVQLASFPSSWGRSTHYSGRLHDFSVITPRCYNDVKSLYVFFFFFYVLIFLRFFFL